MEAVFLNTYGSPVLQALVGLSAQEAESLRRIERDVLREVAEAELRLKLKRLVRGRRASGRGDARHHLCPPARGPCRRTRLAMLKLIRASRPASKRLSLIRFKEVVKDQFLLVSLDQDALPKLLPADETGRQDALMRSSASYQPLDLYPRTRNLALRA